MKRICYMVFATVPDEATADEYVAWLKAGHVADVIRHGASSGRVVRLDRDGQGRLKVLAEYEFASRAVLDAYVADHAPRLRAEGMARFPAERGISWMREVGEVE